MPARSDDRNDTSGNLHLLYRTIEFRLMDGCISCFQVLSLADRVPMPLVVPSDDSIGRRLIRVTLRLYVPTDVRTVTTRMWPSCPG